MKLGSKRTILAAVALTAICLAGAMVAGSPVQAQAPAATPVAQVPRDQLAEVAFKNVQVIRGISVDEFLQTMGFIAASTGLNCTHCHSGNDYTVEAYAEDTIELKQTTRRMVVMMNTINASFFGGQQRVTCWTCHQGEQIPRNVANLQVQYSQVLPFEPDDALEQAPGQPTPDEVFNKYLTAVGGAARANALTSIVGKGTNAGYGPENSPRAMELYARATPAVALTTLTKTDSGDQTITFDGANGWEAVPHRPAPDPVMRMYGDDLAGKKLEAILAFPGKIKTALTDWRVGFPFTMAVPTPYVVKAGDTLGAIARANGTTVDNIRSLNGLSSNAITPGQRLTVKDEEKDMVVVQGRTRPNGPLNKLIFDEETGLLVRLIRYTASPIGKIPTQIDYSDYTLVNGVRIPLTWEVTWTDGRETYRLDPRQTQANVAVPDARFARPAAPVAPPQAAALR